jgi:hypothetical protein
MEFRVDENVRVTVFLDPDRPATREDEMRLRREIEAKAREHQEDRS